MHRQAFSGVLFEPADLLPVRPCSEIYDCVPGRALVYQRRVFERLRSHASERQHISVIRGNGRCVVPEGAAKYLCNEKKPKGDFSADAFSPPPAVMCRK